MRRRLRDRVERVIGWAYRADRNREALMAWIGVLRRWLTEHAESVIGRVIARILIGKL